MARDAERGSIANVYDFNPDCGTSPVLIKGERRSDAQLRSYPSSLGGDQSILSGIGGILGGLGSIGRNLFAASQKTYLINSNDTETGGSQNKPKSEDRNSIREHKADEPAQRMLFFSLVFCFCFSGRVLFIWIAGRCR